MHWLWRSILSVMATFGLGILAVTMLDAWRFHIGECIYQQLSRDTLMVERAQWVWRVSTVAAYIMPTAVLALIAYGILTRIFPSRQIKVNDIRCRKCRYILKGLREPRCPECGEPI